MPAPREPTQSFVPAGPTSGPSDDLAVSHAVTDRDPTTPPSDDRPPVSAGRYELGEEIARGGMGVIYRATDTAFGREVAVKVLREQFAGANSAARRFADEARITGQLQHP